MADLDREQYKEEYDKLYTDDFRTTGDITTELAFNAEWGATAAYACQGGSYAPYCNWGAFYPQQNDYTVDAGTGLVRHKFKAPPTFLSSYSGRNMFLCTNGEPKFVGSISGTSQGHVGLGMNQLHPSSAKGVKCTLSSYGEEWNSKNPNTYLWWGHDVTDKNQSEVIKQYQNVRISTGFRYSHACLYITVSGTDDPKSDRMYGGSFDSYEWDAYPYIYALNIAICYGGKTERLCLSNGCIAVQEDVNFPLYTITTPAPEGYDVYPKAEKTMQALGYLGHYNILNLGENRLTNVYSDTDKGFNFFCTGLSSFARTVPTKTRDNIDMVTEWKTYYTFNKSQAEHIISTLGLIWTGDPDVALKGGISTEVSSDLVRLPIPDGDGVFRGAFARGKAALNYPNNTWGDGDDPYDWYGNNGVDNTPGGGGDNTTPPDYIDNTPPNKPNLTPLGAFNRTYAMSWQNLNQLGAYIWNANESIFDTLVAGLKMMGENPMNCIIDMRMYPFDILSYVGGTVGTNITLGRTQSNVVGIPLNNATDCLLYLGGTTIPHNHGGTFLDYDPYTSLELFIPYIGIVGLDVDKFMGKFLEVYCSIDFTTGACMAMIYADGVCYVYKSGTMGITIPVTGDNASGLASNYLNNITSGVASMVSSNGVGTLLSVGSTISGMATNFGKPTDVQTKGTSTPACSIYAPQYPYVIVSTPITKTPANYGHSVGYACEFTSRIGNLSGWNVFSNVDIEGVSGTETEKNEIKRLLETGVYI